MRFYSDYAKIEKVIAAYERSWRTYERQHAYECAVVSSVPARKIGSEQMLIPAIISDDPG